MILGMWLGVETLLALENPRLDPLYHYRNQFFIINYIKVCYKMYLHYYLEKIYPQ